MMLTTFVAVKLSVCDSDQQECKRFNFLKCSLLYYSDTYMGIKHENTEKISPAYIHHRNTHALFYNISHLDNLIK